MLYRGYPILQLPYQVLHQLLEIDEQLSTWRYRHMSMVHRTIGTRIGTGGSTGRSYLKGALDSHHLYKEIAGLTSFLIERRRLPALSPEMEIRLGFPRTLRRRIGVRRLAETRLAIAEITIAGCIEEIFIENCRKCADHVVQKNNLTVRGLWKIML